MAAGTVLSRVSGFARLLAVAWVLGQGSLADAYNQANTIPNTVYELLLGGILSATLLPVVMESLARYDSGGDDDAVPALVSFLTVGLVVATALFWLAAPVIVNLYLLRVTGARAPDEKALATTWLRLFTPQLLFIGLITVTTALLNARRRFGAVAFSPALANVVTIAALAVGGSLVHHGSLRAYRADATAVAIIGIGTTAGYLAQLAAQLPGIFRARIPLRPRWAPRHKALQKIGRLSGWTVGSVVANQLSFWVVAVLANARSGHFSAFAYAYAFMLLPHAVLGLSISYAAAPELSQSWSEGDSSGFGEKLARALQMTVALVLPAGVGLALLARPAVDIALAHGHLGAASAHLTGSLLIVFALGLPGYSTYLLLMRAFQSKQDTRSMFWLYVVENLLTVVAALGLYPLFGIYGLVAAWIGSYTLTLPLAWARLRASVTFVVSGGWWARVASASLAMAGAVALASWLLPGAPEVGLRAARLCLMVALGVAAYLGAARVFRLGEVAGLTRRGELSRMLRGTKTSPGEAV
jgi:putative peptidoglycan lipid II flippase